MRKARWLQRRKPDPALVEAHAVLVDPGEAEAIALAQSIPEALLIIDDRKGRQLAKQLGLRITGTVGVLLHAVQTGVLPALAPCLDQLREIGFHLKDEVAAELLRKAGEG